MRNARTALVLIGVWGLIAGTAWPQAYPGRPIRLIAPQPPSGTYDYLARVLGERLQPVLGQPVVVVNMPGGGTRLGMEHVARSAPDGHTLLISSDAHAILPSVSEKLAFEPIADFAPISLIARPILILAVSPKLAANSAKEYIALARSKPGTITFGSSGVGTALHLAGELLKSMAGIDIVHVPYKGAAAVVQAVMTDEISSIFGPATPLLPQMRAGKVRALATLGSVRSAQLPDLPTFAEAAALPGYAVEPWFGVLAPAGTPRPIVERLNAEINRIVRDPQFVKEKLVPAGLEAAGTTPEQFLEFLKEDTAKYARIAKSANIPKE